MVMFASLVLQVVLQLHPIAYLPEPGASNGPAEVCLMRELCSQEKSVS